MNQTISDQAIQQRRVDDQTWDEYASTMFAVARMRGEDIDIDSVGIGAVDLFGGAA